MSGVELAARLRALCPGLRVVMMTGDPYQAEVARAHETIVDAVLLKPLAGEDVARGDPPASTGAPPADRLSARPAARGGP